LKNCPKITNALFATRVKNTLNQHSVETGHGFSLHKKVYFRAKYFKYYEE
jgi:hypothetical protein